MDFSIATCIISNLDAMHTMRLKSLRRTMGLSIILGRLKEICLKILKNPTILLDLRISSCEIIDL